MAKPSRWYPVSSVGVLVTSLYALVPPYIVYAQTNNFFPEVLRLPLVATMCFVIAIMLICRYTNQKPFKRKNSL